MNLFNSLSLVWLELRDAVRGTDREQSIPLPVTLRMCCFPLQPSSTSAQMSSVNIAKCPPASYSLSIYVNCVHHF